MPFEEDLYRFFANKKNLPKPKLDLKTLLVNLLRHAVSLNIVNLECCPHQIVPFLLEHAAEPLIRLVSISED